MSPLSWLLWRANLLGRSLGDVAAELVVGEAAGEVAESSPLSWLSERTNLAGWGGLRAGTELVVVEE